MTLNKVPFLPNNELLLGVLDKFQEGRSHTAIVSRFGIDGARVPRRPSSKTSRSVSARRLEYRTILVEAVRVIAARMRLGQLGLRRASSGSGRIHVRTVRRIGMLHCAESPHWRTTKTEITAAVKLPNLMVPSVGSGCVGRKAGNGDTKHEERRRQARGISRWAGFLRTRTRGELGGSDCHRRNRSLLLTLFWLRRVPTRYALSSFIHNPTKPDAPRVVFADIGCCDYVPGDHHP